MLGLSTKTLYAIAALNELDLQGGDKAIKIKEIASGANIPQNFLEQILLTLKKSGILISTKGAHGGYKLNQSLSKITLADIIDILEDGYFQTACKTENAAIKLFWEDIEKKSRIHFDIPLSELTNYRNKINQTLDFSI